MNDMDLSSRFLSEQLAVLPMMVNQLHQRCQQRGGSLPEGFQAEATGNRSGADDLVGPGYRRPNGEMVYLARQVQKAGSLALVHVGGMVAKHVPWWAHSFCCDMAVLDQQLQNIRDDDEVETCVIYFNTPGGFVSGVERTAGLIREVSAAGKTVIGYTDLQCASAGYWLASACDEFYAEGSALVGSISTFCAGYDTSGVLEKMGGKLELFRTGELKAIGLFGKEWTDEERAFMQAKADATDGDFKSFVKTHRGLDDSLMDGGFWYAKHAPDGLVDGLVGSLEEVLGAVV